MDTGTPCAGPCTLWVLSSAPESLQTQAAPELTTEMPSSDFREVSFRSTPTALNRLASNRESNSH